MPTKIEAPPLQELAVDEVSCACCEAGIFESVSMLANILATV